MKENDLRRQGWSTMEQSCYDLGRQEQAQDCRSSRLTLRDLVAREGYQLIIDDNAADHPDALGVPQRDELCAQMCKGNIIRMRSGLEEHVAWYPVSHEIAEDRTDFKGHTQKLWREQLNILSRWCMRLSEANECAHQRKP